jgi:hypothetical protein
MTHNQEVVGSNPCTKYWMDVSDASYYINIHENNENRGAGATFDWLFFDNSKVINFDD